MLSAPLFHWLCISLCLYVCVCVWLYVQMCVYMSTCPSVLLSVCLPHLSVSPPVSLDPYSCPSFSMCRPSVFLSVLLLIYLFMCPSFWCYLLVHLSGCMFFVLSLYLSVSVSAFSVCLSVYLSMYISIYLFSSLSCPVCVCNAYIDKNLFFAGQDTWTQNLSSSGRPSRSRCCLFSEPKSATFYPQHSVTGPPAPTGNP